MTALQYPASYYAATAHSQPDRPTLNADIETQVCVIGAGYTGLSTALHLAEQGLQVVVLEAGQVGYGASGRNGGQIVNSFSRDLDVIERQTSRQHAELLGRMAFEGGQIIRERVKQYNIQCDLKEGGLFAALNGKQLHELQHQKLLWQRYGYEQTQLLDAAAMREQVQSERYLGGLLDHGGGHIHPLNLALGEAAAVEQQGGVIYEHSAVIHIERGNPAVVHTQKGSVKADTVVIAGNAYLGQLIPELAAKSMPCGSQIITTAPLDEDTARALIPHDICIEDCNYLLDYYRLTADRRLLYGGGVIYGARDPADIMSLVRPKMLKTFPQLAQIDIEYAWTGNFLMTLSRLPQMGRLGENIYYSQGCSGHGVTFTHVAGRVLAEAIQGQYDRYDAFAQLKHYPFPGGRLFRVPFTALGAFYYDMRDKLGI
ncbi:gamma-glutamylputrescine oxidoreductase [Terasakiispira papahanaumokuakeensis]|uniref:Gamma-glutamylputrescine oxidoreductase n=1 Tax=Terasakiispira papahanaumokuakeensis TaxID=197479 RepID=A0A1E2VCH3_9GAMM|nr:FAD-binding oxidoreductase [Terasakiispira papahanaumokuakeensis]ODC04697.1 gamma-glutamylputrescine oxidoreductase [Terasakiispira papahanaumokuakeensis]